MSPRRGTASKGLSVEKWQGHTVSKLNVMNADGTEHVSMVKMAYSILASLKIVLLL